MLTKVISLSMDFLLPGSTVKAHPRLKLEIEQWCETELHGEYEIYYASMADRIVYSQCFEMEFEDVNDAVMFKMRWM
jgi:hypothetical protein